MRDSLFFYGDDEHEPPKSKPQIYFMDIPCILRLRPTVCAHLIIPNDLTAVEARHIAAVLATIPMRLPVDVDNVRSA